MENYPKQRFEKEWVQQEITSDIVAWTRSFGEHLQRSDYHKSKALTTSQIRKFFGELKRIQADPDKFKESIPLLKAKLAYAVGRDLKNGKSSTKIKDFQEELDKGLDGIRPGNHEDLVRFIKIVESIVAYHKFYGGKDN